MKTCKTCGHEIPDMAIKCTTCGSFQNWRGHINVSSTVLALLIALVSVVASSIPVLSEMFDQDDSDVNLVYQLYDVDQDNRHNFFFIAANSGTRPAGIGKATFRIELESKNLSTETIQHLKNNNNYSPEVNDILLIAVADVAMLSSKTESAAPFLQPNKSHQLILRLNLNKKPLQAFKISDDTLTLHATDSYPATDEILTINLQNGNHPLIHYQTNSKLPTNKCSVLFDVINYNSEVEKQSVAIDCNAIYHEVFSNHAE